MIRGLLMSQGVPAPVATAATVPVARAEEQLVQQAKKTVKRKASKYQREFGKQLKALKRKHPRTQAKTLMKRAHSATKKLMKRR